MIYIAQITKNLIKAIQKTGTGYLDTNVRLSASIDSVIKCFVNEEEETEMLIVATFSVGLTKIGTLVMGFERDSEKSYAIEENRFRFHIDTDNKADQEMKLCESAELEIFIEIDMDSRFGKATFKMDDGHMGGILEEVELQCLKDYEKNKTKK